MDERRSFILKKTFELFMQFGIKSVSMDDIAHKLGVSKKTLYQHVRDKSELVESALELSKETFQCNFDMYYDDSLNAIEQHYMNRKIIMERIDTMNPSFIFDLRKYYPLLYEDMTKNKREIIFSTNKHNLEKGIKEGFYRPEIDVDVISKIILSYHILIFNPSNGVFTDKECMTFEVWEKAMSYHFHGICSEKGLKEWGRLFNKEIDK